MDTASRVLGRDQELAEIRRFVEATPEGPGGLVLEGTAGIGKTTLWQETVRAAEANRFEILVYPRRRERGKALVFRTRRSLRAGRGR